MAHENELIGCDPNTPARVEGPPINTPHEIAFLQKHEHLPRDPAPQYIPSVAAHEEGELPAIFVDLDNPNDFEGGDAPNGPDLTKPIIEIPAIEVLGAPTGESVASDATVIVEGATEEPVTSALGGGLTIQMIPGESDAAEPVVEVLSAPTGESVASDATVIVEGATEEPVTSTLDGGLTIQMIPGESDAAEPVAEA